MLVMTMNDFYVFRSKGYLATFAARAVIFGNAIANKEFDKAGVIMDDLIRGNYNDFTFPLVFIPNDVCGRNMRDVLDTRYPPAYLISDRLKTLLEENQITGWTSYPIELYDKKKNRIEGYHGFSVVGQAGKMDLSKQPIISIPSGVYNKPVNVYDGGYFDPTTWDGSDFFILKDSYFVIVTKRVYELLKKHKITALEFEQVSKLQLSVNK